MPIKSGSFSLSRTTQSIALTATAKGIGAIHPIGSIQDSIPATSPSGIQKVFLVAFP
jgi:hypothetical protein